MTEILYKNVPNTNGRYFFNEHAILHDRKDGKEVKVSDEGYFVGLEFESGKQDIREDLLKVICFQNIQIPFKFWSKIIPIFVDGDSRNTNPTNLCYRFEEPIKAECLWRESEDFFYVPYYTGYAVSRTGRIYSLHRDAEVIWSVTSAIDDDPKNRKLGYYVAGIRKDVGGRGCGRHRVLCLTFKHYETDPRPLVCNHIDGVPGNDDLDNLELITRAENNQHAIDNGLTPNSVIPVIVRNLNTGQEWKFPSVAKASESLKIPQPTLAGRLHKRSHIRFDDGIVIKRDDGRDWPELTVEKKVSKIRRVVARNVFTGELTIADDCRKLGAFLGMVPATIYQHASKRLAVPVLGFNFRFKDELEEYPFHEHSHKSLQIFKKYPREAPDGVEVFDGDKEVAFFESVELAAVHYSRSISVVSGWCKGKWNPHRLQFKMYKVIEHLGPPIR